MIYKSMLELVGKTPIMEMSNFNASNKIEATLFAKLEMFNPAGSAKDRVAKAIIETAEKEGRLQKGAVIIESTSGNTGIGLAAVASAKGYRTILTMPASMSIERRKLASAYGAEVVLTDASAGMKGAVDKAEELARTIPNSIIAGQFTNPANPQAHKETTAVEIYNDLEGKVDIFVAGIGTGGTISGVGAYLKSKNANIQIVGVEPLSSPLLTEGRAGSHKIQGIGANFVPKNLDLKVIDEILAISDEDSLSCARNFAKTEGLLVGISSGAALCAGVKLAGRKENKGKNIVILMPDTGERYLSTELFI